MEAHDDVRQVVEMMNSTSGGVIGIRRKQWLQVVKACSPNPELHLRAGMFIVNAPTGTFIIVPVGRKGRSPRWLNTASQISQESSNEFVDAIGRSN